MKRNMTERCTTMAHTMRSSLVVTDERTEIQTNGTTDGLGDRKADGWTVTTYLCGCIKTSRKSHSISLFLSLDIKKPKKSREIQLVKIIKMAPKKMAWRQSCTMVRNKNKEHQK